RMSFLSALLRRLMTRVPSSQEQFVLDAIRTALNAETVATPFVPFPIVAVQILLKTLLVLGTFILLYSCLIAVSYEGRVGTNWIAVTRPAVDSMSAHVPVMQLK